MEPAPTCGNAGSETVRHVNPKAVFSTCSAAIRERAATQSSSRRASSSSTWATLNALRRPGTRLSLPLVSVTPEFVHRLTQDFWSIIRKQGMHEDDVTTCQAALDHGADLVKVGVT